MTRRIKVFQGNTVSRLILISEFKSFFNTSFFSTWGLFQREKELSKQQEILKKASEKEKIIREIRAEGQMAALEEGEKAPVGSGAEGTPCQTNLKSNKFRKWTWIISQVSHLIPAK